MERITTEQYRAIQSAKPIHKSFWKQDVMWNKKKKVKSTPNPEDKVWTAFSIYIRTRDCISTCNSLIFGRCCTCNHIVPMKWNDAGHFIGCAHKAIKYHEQNVHLQCRRCNRFQQGKWREYHQFILDRYWREVLEELMSAKITITKWVRDYWQEAKYWRVKTIELKKEFDRKRQ